jgi:hypothetical protein
VVGVPWSTGVVAVLPTDHGSQGSPDVVASRFPGPVRVPPFGSAVVSTRPGGIDPVTIHEPTFAVLVIVKPMGVIATPTVASKSGSEPVGFGVSELARIVAPATESMAPRDAATAAADFRSAPTGNAATSSSATAATRGTGVRCRSATSVAVDRLIQPKRLWAPNRSAQRRRVSVGFMGVVRGTLGSPGTLPRGRARAGFAQPGKRGSRARPPRRPGARLP